MLGIVLCGGQSLRMGADKGLLNHQDKLWANLAGDKLTSLDFDVKFSVNKNQEPAYAGHFSEGKLILDNLSLDVKGPLLGVLSAHLLNPGDDLFLLACDMLSMDVSVLQQLINAFISDETFEAYVFKKNGQQEPLCGIYRAAGLKKIMKMLQTGVLEKHSMKFVLAQLNVFEIPVEAKDYHSFDNFNSHAEVNGL